MGSKRFRLPGKKALVKGFGSPSVVVVDVTETPIERPKRHQRRFYLGKKKRHTLKSQFVVDPETGCIICPFFGRGQQHDFKLFQPLVWRTIPIPKVSLTRAIRVFSGFIATVGFHKETKGRFVKPPG